MLVYLATTSVPCWLTNARSLESCTVRYISVYVIEINYRVQIIIGIAEFTPKDLFFVI